LNVLRASDVRQIEVHTTEPLIPDPSPFEEKLLLQNRKDINRQVMIKLLFQFTISIIQAGGELLRSKIRKLINSIWKKEKIA
jgi:hypothetical protein